MYSRMGIHHFCSFFKENEVCHICRKEFEACEEQYPCRICDKVFHKDCVLSLKELHPSHLTAIKRANTSVGWSCPECVRFFIPGWKGTGTWRYVFISIIIKGRGYIFIIRKKYVTSSACDKGHVYCDYLKSNSHSGIKKERSKEKTDKPRQWNSPRNRNLDKFKHEKDIL